MTWWQRLWRKSKLEEQLEKELRFHLDQHTDDLTAQGLTPDEARRQARIDLGGPEQVKEQCRDARGTRWLEDLLKDLRYAARRLHGNPGFTVVTVLTLALGIGATTAIFSVINPVLLQGLPYPNGSRLMAISEVRKEGVRYPGSFASYREIADRSQSFESIAVMKPWQPALAGTGQPERLDGQRVSATYFHVLGIAPILGRDFAASEDLFRGPNVVIVSNALWQRRFGSDPAIIGHQIKLDESSYSVIGVMPKGFENVLSPSVELWSLVQYKMPVPAPGSQEWGHHLRIVGRLTPGVSKLQAGRELDVISHNLVQKYPEEWGPKGYTREGFVLDSLQDDITRDVKPALLAVLGAVILVLLIGCVNVTNLLLARGAQRRGEFALRAALGAGRMRVIRQLLTESLLLAMIGGAFGLVLAKIGVRALVALSPPELPRIGAIGLDNAVFAFCLVITALVGLAFGLIPALQATRRDLHTAMQQGSRRTASGHQVTRNTLVVVEVALAVVLLTSSGLLLRSFQRLFAVDPGFDSSHRISMQLQLSPLYRRDGDRYRFYEQALEVVRRVPGVESAAFTTQLPLSGQVDDIYGVFWESNPDEERRAFRYAVSPSYFEAMGIPLRRGRLLDTHDAAGAPAAVVINESFANRMFPGQDPIGHRFRFGPGDTWDTIVGVVGDVRQKSLAVSPPDAVYITTPQWRWIDNVQSLVVHSHGDAATLAPAIRNAIWSLDKDQPIVRVATMDDLVAASAADRRFALILFEAFGVISLTLAAIGIYGVLSGSVTERTRELGVRSALGATRGNLLALIVRQGMTLTGLGVVIGLIGAVIASRAVVTLLFNVSRLDPLTYIGVIALLLGVSALACWMPAWRAARVDPAITLRAE